MKQLRLDWMFGLDLDDVVKIDALSYGEVWTAQDFRKRLTKMPPDVGMVIRDLDNKVICYVVYRLERAQMIITRLGVDPCHRRRGFGRALIEGLMVKLARGKRSRLVVHLSELALGCQKWLKACGFQVVNIYHGEGDQGEDVYRFVRGLAVLTAQQESEVSA